MPDRLIDALDCAYESFNDMDGGAAQDMYPTMIQTAVEFCLNIKAYDLLFDEVQEFILGYDLQDVFVEILE